MDRPTKLPESEYSLVNSPNSQRKYSKDQQNNSGTFARSSIETSTTWRNPEYEPDLVMIFARREGGEVKNPEKFTMDRYVSMMMGRNDEKSAASGDLIVDEFHRVFRTDRCYLDESGRDVLAFAKDSDSELSNYQLEQARLETQQILLVSEYEMIIGNQNPTTELQFCELIAKSVARRIQLACGLTTRMFLSVDEDEIIMTIKADDNDLRIEADRIDYLLQVSNKPFDEAIHREKLIAIKHEIGEKEWKASIDHLVNIRSNSLVDEPDDAPTLDPLLTTKGREYQPKLTRAMFEWGHTEEADGNYGHEPQKNRKRSGNCITAPWHALFRISYDPSIYFAPFADYQMDAKFQPYYRRYPLKVGEHFEETLFTQKDRIRLAAGIVRRHINPGELLVSEFLLGDMFALHDGVALQELRNEWALNWLMVHQPIAKIRYYFGEKVAIYFAWLEFYTHMLVFPTVAGLITWLLISSWSPVNIDTVFGSVHERDDDIGQRHGSLLIAFAALVVIWFVLFLEGWRRKNALLNGMWGLHAFRENTHYRPQFRGVRALNPVDNRPEMTFESKPQHIRKLFVSICVVILMIGIVIIALIGFFYLKHLVNDEGAVDEKWRQNVTLAITAGNAVQILILNVVYKMVAQSLNNWENHRTDREYENSLILKVFLFQFCNSFATLFYIAFVKHPLEGQCLNNNCMNELSGQLLILFLIRIVVGNTLEVVVPYLKYRFQLFQERKALKKAKKIDQEEGGDIAMIEAEVPNLPKKHNYIEAQAKLAPYEQDEAFEDYNEMVIQFGFITLFVVAFPLTPLLAFINNILEIHVDSIKLCFVHRRPYPEPTNSIGAWFFILRFMSYIALGTNAALILWTSDMFNKSFGNREKSVVFAVGVLLCVLISMIIERFVPSMPTQLSLLLERYDHIVATVFKGLRSDDDSNLVEVPEALDLEIHDNSNWKEESDPSKTTRS